MTETINKDNILETIINAMELLDEQAEPVCDKCGEPQQRMWALIDDDRLQFSGCICKT